MHLKVHPYTKLELSKQESLQKVSRLQVHRLKSQNNNGIEGLT